MGRSLAALLLVGLLAWGGWALWGPSPRTGGGGGAEGAVPPAPLPAPGAAASPPAASFADGRAGAATPAPAAEAEEIAGLLRKGQAREAVALARALPSPRLRDGAVAAAARDAALALADAPGSGPADRVSRADESRRLLGRLAVEGALPLSGFKDRLDGLNREVLFCGREVPGTLFRHEVRPGDTLDRLMRREWKGRVRAGYGLVLWINSVPSPDRLRAAPILVPEEPVRFLVHKRTHELWALLGEVPVRVFPVGLGMNGRTPEGEFEIEELMPRPDYWPPGGKRVPFGHPENPLGSRWMGFRDTPDAQGFGIHGTSDPDSIGKDLSQGCVRLRNAEVEALFTWAVPGTRVEIRP